MRIGLIVVCLSMLSVEAHAISRYNSTSMTCSGVRSTLRAEGAAILRWKSTRNPSIQRYNRFVSSDRFCESGTRAETTTIPTSDNASCRVYECRQYSDDDDDFFWLRR